MTWCKTRYVSHYFIKMMLSYCLVIVIGLGLVSAFTTSWVVGTLTEKESRIDREIVRQVQTYSDGKYRTIQSIFSQLYMPLSYRGNDSIMDYLNPRKSQSRDEKTRGEVISGYLRDVCSTNAFISDIFIVDYGARDVYFFSNVAGRDTSLDFIFYDQGLLGNDVDNTIRTIPNHIPKYINASSVNNYQVISYGIYLFDVNAVRFNNPLGYIVVNVRADHFRDAYQNSDGLNGTLYVLDEDGLTLFDSSGKLDGQPFDAARYDIESLEDSGSNGRYVINSLASERTGYRFMNIVSREVIQREAGSMRRRLYGIFGLCMVVALAISLLSATLFSRRIERLVKNMQALELGEFNEYGPVRANDEIGYLEQSFSNMVQRLDKYIQTAYVYELKSKTAELKALQAQINPHFLFNTLESIRMNALMNHDDQTAKMIHILGNLLRWNIKTRGMFATLREEIDYAGAFVELQKMRYPDAFEVTQDVPQRLLDLGVPRLILQPLVENAIKHGQKGVSSGGVISIRAVEAPEGQLNIAVEDNGHGMDAETVRRIVGRLNEPEGETPDEYSIGLSNVHQRIRILFGAPYGLTIESEPGVKTVVSIAMPARSREELEAYVQSNHRG